MKREPEHNVIGAAVQAATAAFKAGQAHPLDVAREQRQATDRDESRRRMGFSELEIAIAKEPARDYETREHPGPGMRRVLLQWPTGQISEVSVSVDNSWEWSTARIIGFRREAA